MPQYLSPGVYVEEVPSAARPIAGVGTSTAGFIGVVADDVTMPLNPEDGETPLTVVPVDEPQLVTSWTEFKHKFGDFQGGNKTLAHAVYGFFNNGGSRCWVSRVSAETDLDNLAASLEKFEPIDEIAMVAAPGAIAPIQQDALLDHCEKMLDRVAILDGQPAPATLTAQDIQGGTKNSTYGALYFPWIQVFDPVANAIAPQPPSGHIAGVYARVDSTRGGYKAPANETIRGAVNLTVQLSKANQDGLNPVGVNAIRAFGGNIKIWGARTLGGDDNGEFKYISTRRLFNFLRESIDEGTQFAVFEPNNPSLWQRVSRNVNDFLLGQWRDGALFGDTPKQAFFVKCDSETNPPDVRARGQVIAEVGVAIVQPAEFVIFRIQQMTGS